jgi:hypothetical protein
MANRNPRDLETREHQSRPASWRPPSLLPDPKPEPGYSFRYIRTSMMNSADNTNVSRQLREGYVPVRAEDQPELMLAADPNSRFSGNVEIGGLLLCKIPEEVAQQREAYYRNMAHQQMESVDNNLMRESDPRMPVLRPERSSRTTFGRGPRE